MHNKVYRGLSSDGEWSIFGSNSDVSRPVTKAVNRESVRPHRDRVSDTLRVSQKIVSPEKYKEPIKSTKNMLCPLKASKSVPKVQKDDLNNNPIVTSVYQLLAANSLKPKIWTAVVKNKIAENINNCQKKTTDSLVGGRTKPENSCKPKIWTSVVKNKIEENINNCQKKTTDSLAGGCTKPVPKKHVDPCLLPKIVSKELNNDFIKTSVKDKIAENINNCQKKTTDSLVGGRTKPENSCKPKIWTAVVKNKIEENINNCQKKTTDSLVGGRTKPDYSCKPKIWTAVVKNKIEENINNCQKKTTDSLVGGRTKPDYSCKPKIWTAVVKNKIEENINNCQKKTTDSLVGGRTKPENSCKPKIWTGVVKNKIAENINNCQKKTTNSLLGGRTKPVLKKYVRPCLLPKIVSEEWNNDFIKTSVKQPLPTRSSKTNAQIGVVKDKIAENIKQFQKKTDRLVGGCGNVPVARSHVGQSVLPKTKPTKINNNYILTSVVQPMTARNSEFNVRNGNVNKHHTCCGNDNSKEQHMDFSGGDVRNRYMAFKNNGGYNFDQKKQEKLTTKKSRIIKKKQIINAYTDNTNKIKKPAPYIRKSSSFFNRQAKQREIDRTNYILLQKLLRVKATVKTFY